MSASDQDNRIRLRAIMELFDLSVTDVAKLGGVSRPLLSGLLNGDGRVRANGLWRSLENRLPDLIAQRKRAFFDLEGASLNQIEAVSKAVKSADLCGNPPITEHLSGARHKTSGPACS